MEAHTLIDFGVSICFIDKKLVRQYKLVLMEKNTPMPVKVINGWSLSSRPITHEMKALDITIDFHTNKVIFNVISSLKKFVIIKLSWFALHNP
jgi:hypothetical protein